MRYGDEVMDKLVAWVEANPGVRSALPWVSGGLVVLGLVILMSSVGGGSEEPAPVVASTAQADLKEAADAALEYQTERVPPTFEGFTVSTAEGMAPSLTWSRSETATPGEIVIRVAKSKNLLLISADDSGVYCLALDASGQTETGTVDAEKSGDCTGGWPAPASG
jgi:hypothetical protein